MWRQKLKQYAANIDKGAVFTETVFSRTCLCLISAVYHTTFSLKKAIFLCCLSCFSFPDLLRYHCLQHLWTSVSLCLNDTSCFEGVFLRKNCKNVWLGKWRRCYVPVNTLLGPFPGSRKGPVPNLSISSPSGYICPYVPVSSKMVPSTPGNLPTSCLTGWCQQPWLVPCLASTHGSFSHWLPE